jgi:hypothetical protein
MVALNTAYAAPKNAADLKNRIGDFFYEDHASVGKNRWANPLNAQEKSSYHYEAASGRSNWSSRDPMGELGSALLSDSNAEIKELLVALDDLISLIDSALYLFESEDLFALKEDLEKNIQSLVLILSASSELIGGVNLQHFNFNNPINRFDIDGLQSMDSVSASVIRAIASGNARNMRSLAQTLGKNSNAGKKLLNAAKRAETKARDIIAKECKGSINKKFPEELKDKTLDQITNLAKQGNKAAQTAKKLLNDKRFKK